PSDDDSPGFICRDHNDDYVDNYLENVEDKVLMFGMVMLPQRAFSDHSNLSPLLIHKMFSKGRAYPNLLSTGDDDEVYSGTSNDSVPGVSGSLAFTESGQFFGMAAKAVDDAKASYGGSELGSQATDWHTLFVPCGHVLREIYRLVTSFGELGESFPVQTSSAQNP
ncbi:MAG: hypothetical protein AAF202_08785, partial [Pseudomonadota bacterium]